MIYSGCDIIYSTLYYIYDVDLKLKGQGRVEGWLVNFIIKIASNTNFHFQ